MFFLFVFIFTLNSSKSKHWSQYFDPVVGRPFRLFKFMLKQCLAGYILSDLIDKDSWTIMMVPWCLVYPTKIPPRSTFKEKKIFFH